MIKAIIFDMDGVIIDSEHLKAEAWKKVLENYEVLKGDSWYRRNMGKSGRLLCSMVIDEYCLNINSEDLFSQNRQIYLDSMKNQSLGIPFTLDFIKQIRGSFKLGVASLEYRRVIEEQLRNYKILNLFGAITAGAEEIKNPKPDPEIYLLSAKKLKVSPENCVVIEDNPNGIESAKRAGMYCIGFRNGYNTDQDLSRADIISSKLSILDIYSIIELGN